MKAIISCKCFCLSDFGRRKIRSWGGCGFLLIGLFLFLRQRIFRRNIFSIPAVLEMGGEVFLKDDIFVLRYSSVHNNTFSAHFTYRRHKHEIAVTISFIGGKPLFYK